MRVVLLTGYRSWENLQRTAQTTLAPAASAAAQPSTTASSDVEVHERGDASHEHLHRHGDQ
jgi:hypothetical protein